MSAPIPGSSPKACGPADIMVTSSVSNRSRMHMRVWRRRRLRIRCGTLRNAAPSVRATIGRRSTSPGIPTVPRCCQCLIGIVKQHRKSAYQGTEPCRVITLNSYIERTFSDPTTLFGLKIDTQGYEAHILAGLRRSHHRVKAIVCEMSLAPLYADGPSMSELCRLLAELGYRCVALGPELEDRRTGELLQANGVFVKRG